MTIERPVGTDLESAYDVFEQSINLAFQREGITDEAAEEIEYKKELIRRSVQDSDSDMVFLVAKLGERVIGTISFGPCGDDIRICTNNELDHLGELGSIYILPEFQGKGVASGLIQAMVKHLQSEGVEQFCLDCGLALAQKVWLRKFGAPYVVAKDYWGNGTDHLVWLCNVADYDLG